MEISPLPIRQRMQERRGLLLPQAGESLAFMVHVHHLLISMGCVRRREYLQQTAIQRKFARDFRLTVHAFYTHAFSGIHYQTPLHTIRHNPI